MGTVLFALWASIGTVWPSGSTPGLHEYGPGRPDNKDKTDPEGQTIRTIRTQKARQFVCLTVSILAFWVRIHTMPPTYLSLVVRVQYPECNTQKAFWVRIHTMPPPFLSLVVTQF